MKKLVLAIPKGRILEELNPLLSRSGIIPEVDFFDEKSRKLIFATNLSYLEIVKVRSFDVATFVKFVEHIPKARRTILSIEAKAGVIL